MSFREKVYLLAKTIPAGKVMTYGQIAEMVGSPGAARAVGVCMKENPDNTTIPCHRVVAADGKLTGYAFGGLSAKRDILQNEGAFFIEDRVDLAKSQWKKSTNSIQLEIQL
jgi:methylated-DNA-protein-cysteine methyltransferase related protein